MAKPKPVRVSLDPEDFTAGFMNDFRGTVIKAVYRPWEHPNRGHNLSVVLTFDTSGDSSIDEDEIKKVWKAGVLSEFLPVGSDGEFVCSFDESNKNEGHFGVIVFDPEDESEDRINAEPGWEGFGIGLNPNQLDLKTKQYKKANLSSMSSGSRVLASMVKMSKKSDLLADNDLSKLLGFTGQFNGETRPMNRDGEKSEFTISVCTEFLGWKDVVKKKEKKRKKEKKGGFRKQFEKDIVKFVKDKGGECDIKLVKPWAVGNYKKPENTAALGFLNDGKFLKSKKFNYRKGIFSV